VEQWCTALRAEVRGLKWRSPFYCIELTRESLDDLGGDGRETGDHWWTAPGDGTGRARASRVAGWVVGGGKWRYICLGSLFAVFTI
jgi:hypothetical protein